MRSRDIGQWFLIACALVGAAAVVMAAALIWLLASSPDLVASGMAGNAGAGLVDVITDLAGMLWHAILRFL